MTDLTVLLIEDEPQMRRFLRGSLATIDCKLTEASTGAEGLAAAFRAVRATLAGGSGAATLSLCPGDRMGWREDGQTSKGDPCPGGTVPPRHSASPTQSERPRNSWTPQCLC